MAKRYTTNDRPDDRPSSEEVAAEFVSFQARISGRVHGVGFRMWTVEAAESLGINGWVRNCANGDVEVEAEGTRQTMEVFARRLHEGPTLAKVRNVHITWTNRPARFRFFTVEY